MANKYKSYMDSNHVVWIQGLDILLYGWRPAYAAVSVMSIIQKNKKIINNVNKNFFIITQARR